MNLNIGTSRIKQILINSIIVTLPLMTYINIFGKIKVNFAISDIFVAILVCITLVSYIRKVILNSSSALNSNSSSALNSNSSSALNSNSSSNLNSDSNSNLNSDSNSTLPYWWYFTGLIILLFISNTFAYFNPDINTGSILVIINEAIKLLISACYFYIGYYSINKKESLNKVLSIWMYTALIVSVIGLIITVNTYLGQLLQLPQSSNRLMGTLTDPNLAATYLIISFYISLAYIIHKKQSKSKWLGYISLTLITISIFLTQSRSGIIAFVISLIIYFILSIKRLYRYIPLIILISFIGYFGILDIDAIHFNKKISLNLESRFEQVKELSGEAEVRLNLAKAAFEMGKDNPILGVGRGNYVLNSKHYFDEIGIDTTQKSYTAKYEGKIPHNTYAGFFAELGLLGLILFLVLFYKAIRITVNNLRFRLNLKLNPKLNTVFLSLLIAYLVQALGINLENFRGIWFILGLIFIIDKLELNKETESNKDYRDSKVKFSYKVIVAYIILFIISIFVYIDTAGKYTKHIIEVNKPIVEYIDNIVPNEEYIFRYYIEGHTDSKDKPSSYIKIYSVDNAGKEELLNEIIYWAPKGWGNLIFTSKNNTERIKIQIIPMNHEDTKTVIKDAKVVKRRDGKGELVFVDYKYVPNSIESRLTATKLVNSSIIEDTNNYKLFANKILEDNNYKSYETLKDKSVFFDGTKPINMSNKILFLGATKEDFDNGKTKIKFRFKCIDKMEVDYVLWFHGAVIDKYVLTDSRMQYGFANWDHNLKINTSEWKVGKIYDHEYVIKSKPGQYNLRFGFWNSKLKDGKDGKVYRLYPSVELGLIQEN